MNISKLQFPPQTWIDYIVARIKDDITAYMEKESKRVDICVYIWPPPLVSNISFPSGMVANILAIALGVSLSFQYSPGGPTHHGQSPEGPTYCAQPPWDYPCDF